MFVKRISLSIFVLLACWSGAAFAQQVAPLKREPVEFPREAVRAGVDSGTVKARLAIDAAGNVTDVQIVDANPPRIFDRTVRTSMAMWKFPPGDDKRSFETVVEFKR